MKKNKKRTLKKKKIEQELSTGGRGSFPNNDDIPEDIIAEILSRLPAIALTRFKTACKQWLSLISHPSFSQLRLTNNATTSGLFLYARHPPARKQYILTGRPEGGTLIPLLTIDNVDSDQMVNTRAEHLNGLVLLTSDAFAYVINPTTRRVFKLPFPWPQNKSKNVVMIINYKQYYLFGFDQSQNQHKILHMRLLRRDAANVKTTVFKVFSLSDYSWRNLDNPTLPVDIDVNDVVDRTHSVCVNSVIHVMIPNGLKRIILTFDLISECFSVINLPVDLPREPRIRLCESLCISNIPFLTQINGGLLGLVCYDDQMAEANQIHLWTLQDYENHGVWVRKTITLSADKSWIDLGGPLLLGFCNDNELVFSSAKKVVVSFAEKIPV
uniref:putative F-box protein At1g32420 n=1 Tax=Erigeron canadensis TaxID=72917 RepID=UPI001CB8F79E|nr:putative F-box protein At1g32420 [Erigeron canadensis]